MGRAVSQQKLAMVPAQLEDVLHVKLGFHHRRSQIVHARRKISAENVTVRRFQHNSRLYIEIHHFFLADPQLRFGDFPAQSLHDLLCIRSHPFSFHPDTVPWQGLPTPRAIWHVFD